MRESIEDEELQRDLGEDEFSTQDGGDSGLGEDDGEGGESSGSGGGEEYVRGSGLGCSGIGVEDAQWMKGGQAVWNGGWGGEVGHPVSGERSSILREKGRKRGGGGGMGMGELGIRMSKKVKEGL